MVTLAWREASTLPSLRFGRGTVVVGDSYLISPASPLQTHLCSKGEVTAKNWCCNGRTPCRKPRPRRHVYLTRTVGPAPTVPAYPLTLHGSRITE